MFFFFFLTPAKQAVHGQPTLGYATGRAAQSEAGMRIGMRLGPPAGAKARTAASGGASSPAAGWGGASHSPPSAVEATARWTATLKRLHQRRRQPAAAAARSAAGARGARVATRRRMSSWQSACQRPPSSAARTSNRCGPGWRSSGYRWRLRCCAASNAAPLRVWAPCAGTPAQVK